MVVAYVRPDKHFGTAHDQLRLINSYAIKNDFTIDDEFIDQTSQNKRLKDKLYVTDYFQNRESSILLISDIWVLSTNVEDIVEILTCLLKNNFQIHFIKHSVIVSKQSNIMLVFGLINQFHKKLQSESKKAIGRPKGSKSNSKFDKYIDKIIIYIKEKKNVSEIARLLGVSRSSLKDFIESRELKQVALGSLLPKAPKDAEKQIVDAIICSKTISNSQYGENNE